MSRIYKVTTPSGTKLVKANTKSQAIKHCVDGDYDASPASSGEVYEAMSSGVTIEDAVGNEPPKSEAVGEKPTPTDLTQSVEPALAPQEQQSQQIGSIGGTPTQDASHSTVAPNPVLAEQQRINPTAAAAAGAPPPVFPNAGQNLPPKAPEAQGGPVDWEARERSAG